MSQEERVKFLQDRPAPKGRPVVYWMQASARTRSNHALEYAIHLANHRGQQLRVVFCLHPGYPGANARHYRFLLEGLRDVKANLADRGISFTLWRGDIGSIGTALSGLASTIVVDRGYLRHHRRWREELVQAVDCPVVQVESNVVVPVETASTKEEYSAATIRKKIHREWERFLRKPPVQTIATPSVEEKPFSSARPAEFPFIDHDKLDRLALGHTSIDELFAVDTSVPKSESFFGGEEAARDLLSGFLESRLSGYVDRRNVPNEDGLSGMSPYLHFGHISPIDIAVAAHEYAGDESYAIRQDDLDALLEELIVRRELAINFTEYNRSYDTYDSLPQWSRNTLHDHATDPRPYDYSLETLEAAGTEDPYWNACQNEMVRTGKMHGYMRMYWGKKILEWTADPAEAYRRAVYLNDRYELDGRDPNGYAGVAWVFGKHDRPWTERSIFGKVRYMNANGLRRKFKEIDSYIDRWS